MQDIGSIPGAIPSALLTNNISQHGFESLTILAHSRIVSGSCATSTNPSYISFTCDVLTNASCNRMHSKLIVNRGLVCKTNSTGLCIHGKNDSALSGCMDRKKIVRDLSASQEYDPMTFFLTFTCNQSKHFGVQKIKNWIDSGLWKNHFPKWNSLRRCKQEEIELAVTQSAAGLLLRLWIQVKKAFISYLYSSSTSPYFPVFS